MPRNILLTERSASLPSSMHERLTSSDFPAAGTRACRRACICIARRPHNQSSRAGECPERGTRSRSSADTTARGASSPAKHRRRSADSRRSPAPSRRRSLSPWPPGFGEYRRGEGSRAIPPSARRAACWRGKGCILRRRGASPRHRLYSTPRQGGRALLRQRL